MKKNVFFILLVILISGCATVERKFETIKNLQGQSSKLIFKVNDKNEKWAELTSTLIEPAVITGEYSTDSSGDLVFNARKLKFLVNWTNGWTEGEYSAIGKFMFYNGDGGLHCKIIDKFEIVEIEKGSIRFYDDFYTGEKGMEQVRNRFDRIQEVNSFLKTKNFKNHYNHPFLNKKAEISFKSDTMGFLFPELVLDSVLNSERNKMRDVSDDFKIKNPIKEIDLKESVFWNKLYTGKNFPVNLQEIRNSGTMLRDYEESLWIFYFDYNFDYFLDKILVNEIFREIKK